jgi:hypothetical protein
MVAAKGLAVATFREARVRSTSAIAALLLAGIAAPTAYAAQPYLTTGQWTIVEMGGKRARTPATINFTRVRWLGLETSCGPLWGWYRWSGTSLRIHISGRGRLDVSSGSPCQGIDYRLLLGRVRSFSHETDQLVFLSQDGKPVARLVQKK